MTIINLLEFIFVDAKCVCLSNLKTEIARIKEEVKLFSEEKKEELEKLALEKQNQLNQVVDDFLKK